MKMPQFVKDRFGLPVQKKERVENRAVLWAQDLCLDGIRSRQQKTARLVLLCLAISCNTYGDPKASSYVSWADYRRIQQVACIGNRDTVKSARENLERIGAIEAHRLNGKYGQDFFVYQLHIPAGSLTAPAHSSPTEPARGASRFSTSTIKGVENSSKKRKETEKVAGCPRNRAALEDREELGEEIAIEETFSRMYQKAFDGNKIILTKKIRGQLGMFENKMIALGADPVAGLQLAFADWPMLSRAIDDATSLFKPPSRPCPSWLVGGVHIVAEKLAEPVKRYAWQDYQLDFE